MVYDGVFEIDPFEVIAGDNGRDGYGEVQELREVLVSRGLGFVRLGGIEFGDWCRGVLCWEQLVRDQYGNVYYLLHGKLCDGEWWTWCDRVRTEEGRNGYELCGGWDYVFWRCRRDGKVAMESSQKAAMGCLRCRFIGGEN